MKITISQEGANPITIDTENIRSEEEYTPGKIYNAARVGITAAKHMAPDILKAAGKLNTAVNMAQVKKEAVQAGGHFLKRLINKEAAATYKNTLTQGAQRLAATNYKVFFDKGAREAAKQALKTGTSEVTTKQVLGTAALGIASTNPVLLYFLTSVLGPSLAATVYNTIASIGTFKSGDDFMESKQFMDKLALKIKGKYNRFPTITDVKNSSKAKTKSGFLAWVLGGGQAAGDTVRSQDGSTKFLMKRVDGVPVAVTQLMPVLGTMDLKQILGKRVLIATAFVLNEKGEIKSIPLCRGYLSKGLMNKNEVNSHAHDDKTIESGNVIMGYFSNESSGPIFTDDVDEFMSIGESEELTW